MSQIKVLITDSIGGSETIQSPSSTTPVSSTINHKNGSIKTKEVQQNKLLSKGMAAATMIGSQALSYTTSNIGKWTGSIRMQQNVNNVSEIVSIGALAYASMPMALAYVGITLAKTAIDTSYEQRWDTYYKEEARKRAGELKGRGR